MRLTRFVAIAFTVLAVAGLSAQRNLQRLGAAPSARVADQSQSVSERSASAPLARGDRGAIAALYKREYLPFRNAVNGWNGAVNSCRAGENSAEYDAATLRVLRFYRRMAGVSEDVEFDPQLNRLAIKAALIMEAKSDLSHNPPASWPCYSEDGKKGASSSNLCLGCVGPGAISAYIDDQGVVGVGHRRWALHPLQQKFGTGSTRRAHALYVFGTWRESSAVEYVAWPPQGFVPHEFGHSPRYPWSLEVYSGRADYSATRITVQSENRSLRVQRENSDAPLVWFLPELPANPDRSRDRSFAVRIENVLVDGQSKTFEYQITFFNPDRVDDVEPDPEPAPARFDAALDLEVTAAARRGDAPTLRSLLARRGNPDAAFRGWTALHFASFYGHDDCVSMLLAAGANAGASIEGWTALQLAEYAGHSSVAALLAGRSAAPRSRHAGSPPAPPR